MRRRNKVQHHLSKETGSSLDKGLLILTVVLTIFGIIAVADASAPQAQAYLGNSFYYVKQQIMWGIVGLIGLVICSFTHYSFWKKVSVPLFMLSLASLLFVLVPGVGVKVLGARRWLSIGPIGFQPSELVKLTLVMYFARLAEVNKNLRSYMVILAGVAGLIMLQPDLGTTLIVTGIGFVQIFVSGANLIHLAGFIVTGGVGALILILTSDYRRARLMTFFESSTDPQGTSYHISQILIALGSGGLWGVGLGQSRQKYLFLPESATDSVFAVIAEEIGFLGSSIIILLFLLFVYKGITIASKATDPFAKVLAAGIVSWIGIQAFLNISSMVALSPLTGVPMPFFSYGGSSLTMILVGIGILLNISKYGKR